MQTRLISFRYYKLIDNIAVKVYVLGNPYVASDSLPLQLLAKLSESFPSFTFIEIDPTENFVPENDSVILDTVAGIHQAHIFDNVYDFKNTHAVSLHDFDLGTHLVLLTKLKKIGNVCILGVPTKGNVSTIFNDVCKLIRMLRYGG